MPAIFKDDIGTVFEVTVKDESSVVVNVSGATLLQFKFKKPTGVLATKTAVFSSNGVDGKIRYTTVSGDLDVAGEWEFQAYIEIGTSPRFHTSYSSFVIASHS